MLRDNRNSSNCFQKLIFAENCVFAVYTLVMNNLLNRFWIIWPQVIHFLFFWIFCWPFCWHFCFWKCWHLWTFCWQNVVIFLVQYLCFTVLTLYDCPIEANDRFMVLRRDVIRLQKVIRAISRLLWCLITWVRSMSYGSYHMLEVFEAYEWAITDTPSK